MVCVCVCHTNFTATACQMLHRSRIGSISWCRSLEFCMSGVLDGGIAVAWTSRLRQRTAYRTLNCELIQEFFWSPLGSGVGASVYSIRNSWAWRPWTTPMARCEPEPVTDWLPSLEEWIVVTSFYCQSRPTLGPGPKGQEFLRLEGRTELRALRPRLQA